MSVGRIPREASACASNERYLYMVERGVLDRTANLIKTTIPSRQAWSVGFSCSCWCCCDLLPPGLDSPEDLVSPFVRGILIRTWKPSLSSPPCFCRAVRGTSGSARACRRWFLWARKGNESDLLRRRPFEFWRPSSVAFLHKLDWTRLRAYHPFVELRRR